MRSRSTLRWFLLTIGCLLVGRSLFIAFPIVGGSVIDPVSVPVSVPVGQPIRLKIPVINVDAELESVGLLSGGELDVPKGQKNAGWYEGGPCPGEKGSAVIDAHFGWWKSGTEAVFNNLNKLKVGDRVYIEDENGVTVTFVVRELKMFGEHEDASTVFTSSDGKSYLNLITCGGAWDATTQGYVSRLVVFTEKMQG